MWEACGLVCLLCAESAVFVGASDGRVGDGVRGQGSGHVLENWRQFELSHR